MENNSTTTYRETYEELKQDFATPLIELKVISITELLQTEFKPHEFILGKWLATQSLSMIHAYRGVGKTFVALNIAYAIASGGSFLGWHATKPRGVLYIDGEMPASALKERMSNIIVAAGKEPIAPLMFITPDAQKFAMPDLSTEEGQAAIKPFITDEIDLIIIDNLSCLVRSGRENESESWKPIQEWALRLRAEGKSLLFIHHSGKTGKQRGCSKREDVLDTVICLKRPENCTSDKGACFEVEFEKARYLHGEDVALFEAQLITDENGLQQWVTSPRKITNFEKTVDLYNQGLSQKDIGKTLGIDKSVISRNIHKAKELNKICT